MYKAIKTKGFRVAGMTHFNVSGETFLLQVIL